MPLTSLPAEILHSIFELARISETNSKLDWLIVSKYLSNVALPFLLEDVTLSDRGLRTFSALLSQKGGSYIIPSKVKRLSISLKGYREHLHLEGTADSRQPYWPTATTWGTDTMINLQILTKSLHEFTALESFSFVAAREFDSKVLKSPFEPVRDYLYHAPTFSLLNNNIPTNRLTDLTIDTCGSSLLGCTDDPNDSEYPHICPLISKYLLTVGKVKIRMRRICPDIFDLPNTINTEQTAVAEGNPPPPKPQTIVINISLYAPKDYLFATRLSDPCGLSGPCSHNLFVDQMFQAGALFMMPRPRTEVIIVSRDNGVETRAVYCRTGLVKVLKNPDDWLTCDPDLAWVLV